MVIQKRRGLSNIVGSLLLILIVFLAWAFLYHYGLNYIHILSSSPDISVRAVVILMNYQTVQNPGVIMLELYISDDAYTPFMVQHVLLTSNGITMNISGNTFYTAIVPYSQLSKYQTTLPMTVRQAYTQLLYTFVSNFQVNQYSDWVNQGNYTIVTIQGQLGSSVIQIQTSAQVVSS
ncbi:archaellin/type IV pilin N-terminal domain-containing protein [Sulfurisphaera ohwakuensis]|uniref:Flagellin-like protein n=1 Tax=Sulfurisphaera ohwakuensis TaxID=69656 RepID=A0A650CGL0_SULOH|nr:archaellin/type IV pilin N-terminal domain-containing protein [Sulfurisphaera ohwakuensis]MBB5252643.1 flagellin-like protein [Sulfurisphaera ohwakuensis]QGR16923.1 hypothetical protein D1869_06840 [Sulfurisphaera ohwakuensis]